MNYEKELQLFLTMLQQYNEDYISAEELFLWFEAQYSDPTNERVKMIVKLEAQIVQLKEKLNQKIDISFNQNKTIKDLYIQIKQKDEKWNEICNKGINAFFMIQDRLQNERHEWHVKKNKLQKRVIKLQKDVNCWKEGANFLTEEVYKLYEQNMQMKNCQNCKVFTHMNYYTCESCKYGTKAGKEDNWKLMGIKL